MATVASVPAPAPADQATDLLQKLSLEPKNIKISDAPEDVKKLSGIQYGSANGVEVPNSVMPQFERSLTPILQEYMDGSMCYLPNGFPSTTYYYGGYDGSINEWEEYPRYLNPDGVEMPLPGVYGDLYHHGYGYGYAPYGPYPSPGSTVPTLGHDGQLYSPQHFHYPAPYYQQPIPTSAPNTVCQPPSSKGDVSTSAAADQPPIPVETTKTNPKGNANGNNGTAKVKLGQQISSLNSSGSFSRGVSLSPLPSSGYQVPRFGFDGMWSSIPWFDSPVFQDGQQRPATSTVSSTVPQNNNTSSARNQNMRPVPQLMSIPVPRSTSGMGPTAPGIMNRIYPNNRIYGQSTNAYRNGFSFGPNTYDSRMNGWWGLPLDNKYKNRGRGNGFYGYGNDKLDGLTEQIRGPRADHLRNQKFTLTVKGQSLPVGNFQDATFVPDKDQYNKADFPETYLDAKFFIIKSYSEDDVHKSVKYSVWASTPSGNKKLDAAYREAQEKTAGCPVFLFFSVNTSGQFVGLAEMVGPVDFSKNLDYWQQDKWTGCFPVKWHIVKDVPNSILKHITLENNDNKPVTNSRDTQEVKLDQGLQMLKVFKEHVSKTYILEDFSFYENRQKVMQEKRTKQQQLQNKALDGKSLDVDEKDKDGSNGKPRLQVPLEAVTLLKKEPAQGGFGDNGIAAVTGVSPKDPKLGTEKRVVSNGIANGF